MIDQHNTNFCHSMNTVHGDPCRVRSTLIRSMNLSINVCVKVRVIASLNPLWIHVLAPYSFHT